MENVKKSSNTWPIIRDILIYTGLIIWAILVAFPFFYMILTALKTSSQYNSELTPMLYANPVTFKNFTYVLTEMNLWRNMANSLFFSLATTAITLIVIIPAAFAFARLEFKGKEVVFVIFLAMMMIPNELVIITNYYTAIKLDWRNSFTGLIMPSVMSVFYVYFLRQTFAGISDEIYFAAKVDGTSDFKYMLKVMVPIAKPTIISIVILKVIECWNSYVWPRLITTDKSRMLISQAVQEIGASSNGRTNVPAVMAAVVIVSVPIIILFIIFRKQIMAGVSRSGTKG